MNCWYLNIMKNFESEQNFTVNFNMNFLSWIEVFHFNFDFIWFYFDLISLVSQLFFLILQFIWDSYWVERTTEEWSEHENLFIISTVNQEVFIDADWMSFLFSYILFILIGLFWFISLILLIFIDILKLADQLFSANLGGCVAFSQYFDCLHCLAYTSSTFFLRPKKS